MSLPTAPTPVEFGDALRARREAAGVTLEEITERTKISRRTLEAFETGEFAKLPSGAFPRMFLRQFVATIGDEPEPWLSAFTRALERFAGDSQVVIPVAPGPSPARRLVPWLVGLLLVAAALIGVVLVERHQDGERSAESVPTPEVLLSVEAPTPVVPAAPTPMLAAAPTPVPAAAVTPTADVVHIRSGERACWVQVTVAGERSQSRLLAAGSVWEVPGQGKGVDLVLGDGGSVEIDYLGRHIVSPGASGEVTRLHLGPEGGDERPRVTP
ncbi:MAG: helix-turn-helix domain-containing protein [Acidobacteriota bacterium]